MAQDCIVLPPATNVHSTVLYTENAGTPYAVYNPEHPATTLSVTSLLYCRSTTATHCNAQCAVVLDALSKVGLKYPVSVPYSALPGEARPASSAIRISSARCASSAIIISSARRASSAVRISSARRASSATRPRGTRRQP